MSLTDREMQLVTESFTKVAPVADTAASLFYNRLFEIMPETKALFRDTDMTEQGRKLMQTLATAVGSLGRMDMIEPALVSLGKRHVAYGVRKEHYAVVGQALLWTLEQALGDEFNDEMKTAWTKVYTALADIATSVYKDPVK